MYIRLQIHGLWDSHRIDADGKEVKVKVDMNTNMAGNNIFVVDTAAAAKYQSKTRMFFVL